MACVHLKELYQLCEQHDLKIAGADLVRIVCRQCGEQDVCPAALTDGEQVLRVDPHEAEPETPDDPGKAPPNTPR